MIGNTVIHPNYSFFQLYQFVIKLQVKLFKNLIYINLQGNTTFFSQKVNWAFILQYNNIWNVKIFCPVLTLGFRYRDSILLLSFYIIWHLRKSKPVSNISLSINITCIQSSNIHPRCLQTKWSLAFLCYFIK